MSARGFVEGRRPGTPPAKITDREIKVEDARHMTRAAKASRSTFRKMSRTRRNSCSLNMAAICKTRSSRQIARAIIAATC